MSKQKMEHDRGGFNPTPVQKPKQPAGPSPQSRRGKPRPEQEEPSAVDTEKK
jgi:hypothetical protein